MILVDISNQVIGLILEFLTDAEALSVVSCSSNLYEYHWPRYNLKQTFSVDVKPSNLQLEGIPTWTLASSIENLIPRLRFVHWILYRQSTSVSPIRWPSTITSLSLVGTSFELMNFTFPLTQQLRIIELECSYHNTITTRFPDGLERLYIVTHGNYIFVKQKLPASLTYLHFNNNSFLMDGKQLVKIDTAKVFDGVEHLQTLRISTFDTNTFLFTPNILQHLHTLHVLYYSEPLKQLLVVSRCAPQLRCLHADTSQNDDDNFPMFRFEEVCLRNNEQDELDFISQLDEFTESDFTHVPLYFLLFSDLKTQMKGLRSLSMIKNPVLGLDLGYNCEPVMRVLRRNDLDLVTMILIWRIFYDISARTNIPRVVFNELITIHSRRIYQHSCVTSLEKTMKDEWWKSIVNNNSFRMEFVNFSLNVCDYIVSGGEFFK